MPTFSAISLARLRSCDQRLQLILFDVIEIVDFIVLEGHRGEQAQNEAVRRGTSKLRWPYGKHNAQPSRAVDIAPYIPSVDGKIDWKDIVAFGRLMGVVQGVAHRYRIPLRFGLDWDGDFRTAGISDPNETFLDAPHVELVEP